MVGSDWRILGRSDYNMKICTLPFPQTPFLGKGTYYRFAQYNIVKRHKMSVTIWSGIR